MRDLVIVFAAAAGVGGIGAVQEAHAEVTLPTVISEGMVLQRNTPVRIYGKANPEEEVSVSIQGKRGKGKTNAKGDWEVIFKSLSAGGPFALTIEGKTNKILLEDVYVGEVWVCSGQSNMEWNMGWSPDSKADAATASDPLLRMFTVEKKISPTSLDDVRGKWEAATAETAPHFSAVGYYFARSLREALKVPIGMIHTSWGGTRIEAWTSRNVLLTGGTPPLEFALADPASPLFQEAKARHARQVDRWKAAGSPEGNWKDPGSHPTAKGWGNVDYDDHVWGRIQAPGAWENSSVPDLEALDGAVWFRKKIKVPTALAGKPMTLNLGTIDDEDVTFFNGIKVGSTIGENAYSRTRKYAIPGELVKAGDNVIAVRIWDQAGEGGFTGQKADMFLTAVDATLAETPIPLAGEWFWRIEIARPQKPGAPPGENDPNAPSVLYNGMLYPLRHYTIKGALWYQGESNAGNPSAYRRQMPAMIENWRKLFNIEDMPFLAVQLAPFMAITNEPTDTNWAALREAQSHTAAMDKNVGVAVITDAGDEKDIHPAKKHLAGERLALLARKIAYGEKIVAESPVLEKMDIRDGKAILTFRNTGEGLEWHPTDSAGHPVPEGKLVGFAIAGPEGKFVWGDAVITGKNEVTVSAATVPNPSVVRFGWADYPVVNLYSKSGLPASPFRTDAPLEMPKTTKRKSGKKKSDATRSK